MLSLEVALLRPDVENTAPYILEMVIVAFGTMPDINIQACAPRFHDEGDECPFDNRV